MGVPTSEVGYTSAMPRREDHEVHKEHVVALGGKTSFSPKLGTLLETRRHCAWFVLTIFTRLRCARQKDINRTPVVSLLSWQTQIGDINTNYLPVAKEHVGMECRNLQTTCQHSITENTGINFIPLQTRFI
jgi:hypothetical protein